MSGMSRPESEHLSESKEDCLETILAITEQEGVARVGQIAERLGVSPPTVTTALKALAELDLVNYEPYHFVTMTDSGKRAARLVTRRHRLLKRFLIEVLELDEEAADENACRMEHAVDRRVIRRVRAYLERLEDASDSSAA
jgi:DtxR family Mn-dependent transcriptional regulator